MEKAVAAGPDFSRVFVLYGALRSGTTLLRLLLDHHPHISCPGERDFLIDHIDTQSDRFDREGLEHDWIFATSSLQLPETQVGSEAFVSLLKAELESSDAVLVLVIHRHLGRLLDLLPGCRFIHLIRDPRDVARSSIGMGWAGNTWFGIRHWLRTERDWQRESHRIAQENVHEIKFEKFVSDPEIELQNTCKFLGLDYNPAMMEYVQSSTYSDLDPELTFQWKKKQSATEISHVEYQVGNLLTDLGYEPSGHAITSPSAVERSRLWLHNKVHIWRNRVQRYGLIMPVIASLARRAGLTRLQRRAAARINKEKILRLK